MSVLLSSKEVKNASWIILGKILQVLISLLVSLLTARYLGPSNYGLINYGAAYVSFFTVICNLGINFIIVKEFLDNPDDIGTAIGTSVFMRFLSSILSLITIVTISFFIDRNEPITVLVVGLCGLSLFFNVFEIINYWFQSRYQSKISSIVGLIAYLIAALYKIILLVLHKDVIWFALATSIDYLCVSFLLILAYQKYNGPSFKLSFEKGKKILSKSYHYIISTLMVAVYAQTDKIMLKHMLSKEEVGYYSVAVVVCATWVFILSAIIDSMYPTIITLYKADKQEYIRKNKQLYFIVFYVSIMVSVIFVLWGEVLIKFLYGNVYMASASMLKVVTWYTAFSYLGVARNAWIVCENKQKYLKYIYGSAAIINVALNFILIPIYGGIGAAVASLMTNIGTSVILPLFIKSLRPNSIIMLEAIMGKGVFKS